MSRPIALDLCSGLGGWAEGLEAEGWDVIRVDIADMFAECGTPKPANCLLMLQDIMTFHGSQAKHARLIVASPPCQEYSYMAMPWSLAKSKAARIRADETGAELERLNRLFNACFRIQREACEAADRYIPLVLENVRGAQEWVGRAAYNYGSYYLWGDVPLAMPRVLGGGGRARQKSHPGEQWNVNRKNFTGTLGWDHSERGEDGRKNPGFRFDGSGRSFQTESVERHVIDGVKVPSDTGRSPAPGLGARFTSRDCGDEASEGHKGAGGSWIGNGYQSHQHGRNTASNSRARKAASAKIAKIPERLSRHIGRVYHPDNEPPWQRPKQLTLEGL